MPDHWKALPGPKSIQNDKSSPKGDCFTCFEGPGRTLWFNSYTGVWKNINYRHRTILNIKARNSAGEMSLASCSLEFWELLGVAGSAPATAASTTWMLGGLSTSAYE